MVGLAQLERGAAADAALTLGKALELARDSGAAMEHEVWRELCRAKYDAWRGGCAARAAAREALLTKLEALVAAHAGASVSAREGLPAPAEAQPPAPEDVSSAGEPAQGGDEPAVDISISALVAAMPQTPPSFRGHAPDAAMRAAAAASLAGASPAACLAALRGVFAAAAAADAAAEAPPELCCPLTLDVYRDPVVAPSGHSYERSALLEHLAKVCCFIGSI
jgi:hypothetical protein